MNVSRTFTTEKVNTTLSARLGDVVSKYYRLKTMLFYRLFFRSIGVGSRIIKPMSFHNAEFVEIGKGVTIRNGARIECVRTKGSPEPRLTIGDGTQIGQGVHIMCRSRVNIGRNVAITPHCVIVDVDHNYENVADNDVNIATLIDLRDRPVEIGDYTFLGANVVVTPGTHIGRHCVIGANVVVSGHIPDGTVLKPADAVVAKRYDFDTKVWEKVKPAEDASTIPT